MACTQTLAGLAADCAGNIGGIKNVYLANHADVSAVTLTTNKVTAITMASTAKFKKYSFKRGTGSMSSTLNADPQNGTNYVSTDLVLQFNRMETTKRVEMAALAVGELAVIVEDMNGKFWYLGYDEPVSATAGDGQTGTARSDGNRYTITLQDNAQSWPYEVDSTVITTSIIDTI